MAGFFGWGLGSRPQGGPVPLDPGARIVFAGHSKVSQNSASGMRNFGSWTITKLAGLARLAIGGDQGIGGNTVQNYSDRRAFTTAQAADITFVLIAHNSLGSPTLIADLSTLKANLEGANPRKYLIFATEPPSAAFPPSNPALQAVNAHIASFDGGNRGRTRYCDFVTGFDYPTMTYVASGDVNIHPNEVGANFMATRANAVIAPLFTQGSLEAVLDDTSIAGDHGADTCPAATHNMTFTTGGVKAGTGAAVITGDIADKFTVRNETTCDVVCSTEVMGGYRRQVLEVTGTGVAEGQIYIFATDVNGARAPINAVIGDAIETLWGFSLSHKDGVSAPLGLLQHGAEVNTTIAGRSLGTYSSTEPRLSGGQGFPIFNEIARTYPKVQPVARTNLSPTFGVRVAGNVNIRLVVWKPICRKTELAAYAVPRHLGSDGIMGAEAKVGFRNGVALSNGNSIAFQSGPWSGGGVSYGSVRVYQGGTAGDAGIGTGTLVATIAPGVWTWTASVTAGQSYFVEMDVSNNLGSATARSATAVVAVTA